MDKMNLNILIKDIESFEKECSKECIKWTKCIVNPSNNSNTNFHCNELFNNYINCIDIDKNRKK